MSKTPILFLLTLCCLTCPLSEANQRYNNEERFAEEKNLIVKSVNQSSSPLVLPRVQVTLGLGNIGSTTGLIDIPNAGAITIHPTVIPAPEEAKPMMPKTKMKKS